MNDSARRVSPTEPHGPRSQVRPSSDSLIGRTIDRRYKIESRIGEGGMGLVYRARHVTLNKPLAIKVLQSDSASDEEVLHRFRREAQSASAIGNEHIVDVSDFGSLEDGSTYFVMEYLMGRDLIRTIDAVGRMPESRAIHIARQLCSALGAAHGAGIVHRDLKPENVLLIRRGKDEDFVKILDFGIAKVAHVQKKITRAGEVFGTPHYMSPEQCEGNEVDHRTDIYALGVLLYEMVTGNVPHDADTMMAILTKHLYEDPVPPSVRAPDVSSELEAVILRCLRKKREERYHSMAELDADLERAEVGTEPRGPATLIVRPTRPPVARLVRSLMGVLGVGMLALLGTLIGVAVDDGDSGGARPGDEASIAVVAEPTAAALPPVTDTDRAAVLESDPRGAQVWARGERQGATPFELSANHQEWDEITLVHDGYRPTRIRVADLRAHDGPMRVRLRRQTEAESATTPSEPALPIEEKATSSTDILVNPWRSRPQP